MYLEFFKQDLANRITNLIPLSLVSTLRPQDNMLAYESGSTEAQSPVRSLVPQIPLINQI
jgi:hypothetical protein